MADFPYLPIWVADFIGDTEHLDCIETGAYLLLLFAAWRSPKCGLPDDDRKLARLARCSLKQWQRTGPVVMAFWKLAGDGLWHQKRLDEVRSQASVKSLKAVQSAQAMWLKRRERESADAERTPSGRNANHSYNHIKTHESDLTTSTDAAREPAPDSQAPARAQASLVPERPPGTESPEARDLRLRLADITAAKRAAFLRGNR
jgi:uncharacterized protein YdaU (DUF1376 family)